MATHSSRRYSGPVLHRLTSPAARTSAPFASTSAAFSSHSSSFDHHLHHHHQNPNRSASPTRINLAGPTTAVKSQQLRRSPPSSPAVPRKSCMCSPTTHPGSFRCSLHKGLQIDRTGRNQRSQADLSPSNRLNMRRSAMTNSIVRIGTVEGDLVKRALASLIRPSSHQQRRRAGFQPRLSRLSIMSKAED